MHQFSSPFYIFKVQPPARYYFKLTVSKWNINQPLKENVPIGQEAVASFFHGTSCQPTILAVQKVNIQTWKKLHIKNDIYVAMENTLALLSYCNHRYPVHSDSSIFKKIPWWRLNETISTFFAFLFRKLFHKQGNSAIQREHQLPVLKKWIK